MREKIISAFYEFCSVCPFPILSTYIEEMSPNTLIMYADFVWSEDKIINGCLEINLDTIPNDISESELIVYLFNYNFYHAINDAMEESK